MGPPQRRKKPNQLERRQKANKLTAIVVPCFLIAIVGYATYAMVVPVCIHYYLYPGPNNSSRPAAGIPILVIFLVLLMALAASYLRILLTIFRGDCGYIAQGDPDATGLTRQFIPDRNPFGPISCPSACTTLTKRKIPQSSTLLHDPESSGADPYTSMSGRHVTTLDTDGLLSGRVNAPPGLESFYSRDVFQCDPRGLPLWCGNCNAWKADRVHHCSDVGRCVANLDHFCPWVGGVVSETNFKFFVQLNFYATLYTLFDMVVVACTLADRSSHGDTRRLSVHFIVLIALAGFFFLFTAGLLISTLQHVLTAMTTVDAIDPRSRTMHLAVRLTENDRLPQAPLAPEVSKLSSMPVYQGTITFPLSSATLSFSRLSTTLGPRHVFAILQTPTGLNPWDLGPRVNFEQIMGHSWVEWLLPIKSSPCTWRHERMSSLYPLGPQFDRLRRDTLGGRPLDSL